MDRVAFNIFGVSVMWYGIIIAVGMVVALLLAIKLGKNVGFSDEVITDWFLWTIPLSVVGARLYYVVFEWENYAGNISEILNIRGGGLAIHGGILSGLIISLLYCKIKKIPFWKFADIIAPAVVLAQGIGRWGNFVNGEAHGGPTDLPWAILVDGARVHPTFLYESICDVLIAVFLIWYSRRKKVDGECFLLYIILYSSVRFFIEALRTDSLYFLGFKVAQLISVIGIIAGIILLFYKRSQKKS